jgi:SAM-dependent methyltransferase
VAHDQQRLDELLGRAVGDFGGALQVAMGIVGDRLGLYRALRDGGPQEPAALAKRTHTSERYVREWLDNQAAGGYVTYDAATRRYSLSPEQAMAVADESSPAFLPGGWQVLHGAIQALPRLLENFKTGEGMGWGEHHADLFEGTERFFRPGYAANLVSTWLPALEGVVPKLERGADVADVGCGLGASTILMAKAYPRSRFTGFDAHPRSIELARERARAAGVGDRVRFEVAKAEQIPGTYDLVTYFDCLHDMSDPVAAARRVHAALREGGTWMLVEPAAADTPEANHNPVGRVYYGASTLICVPNSLHGGGPALGAQAGPKRLEDVVVRQAGFRSLERAAQTPFNIVLEARR